MGDQSSKRPWLAAGLTLFVPGLGQLYLRRWLRALGWITLLVTVSFVFVPESVFTDVGSATLWDGLPLVIVGTLCVLDAYLLAQHHNLQLEAQGTARCSSCYRELDTELSFCPWCATADPDR
ncbi:zinc ribbon domain-containing protein [Natronolimnobius sp. AArcel1]|uniref:DUF7575 domain-containing protein n=1 Tax=Natronolimnobius sp. AArcel1 TaxID=1679093 RepID=UPI0013EA954D|nr:zinc ribbon domain-containing protein [Natronolimnobius sp. AArcel1]NGM67978.1 zinc ribbon domain-containing protein [Natronolimnobius sp. AArcel1]